MSPVQEHASLFTQVETKKRGSLVAEQILDAIKAGRLKAGDLLPSERDLALQTGISRPSVREAISALELIGIVECHPGQRTLVTTQARDVALLSSALPDLTASAQLSEALEVRRIVDGASVELLISNHSVAAVQDLEYVLDELRSAAKSRDFERYNLGNVRFHEVLANASGNSLLERILYPLMNMMLGSIARELRHKRYAHEPDFFDTSLAMHEEIGAAYKEGDADRLRAAFERHYQVIEESL